ncbi:uncharacterized protein MONBRDRAFT_34461 [Monosiga brevicollis MX1]|uniref:FCP1 homology domain-containing protein n=1 Tax=Monosiga brevicollis TaxID=81824 RepID=A9VBW4_MONBE|nr:uncharacterized protein MONBRDRAFT_34461 [Monosiga brevicollis MX1]EDQ85004.1 predicted protein [Monosiga brevicollis MX1]|eukprot:XP_001750174.1 hypothetical protein [Monosiga brevicollis MX1]
MSLAWVGAWSRAFAPIASRHLRQPRPRLAPTLSLPLHRAGAAAVADMSTRGIITQVDESGSYVSDEPAQSWWQRSLCCCTGRKPEQVVTHTRQTQAQAANPTPLYGPPVPNADFILPIEIDGTTHNVYVLKRPFVDEFLEATGKLFEVVLFTASLPKYASPVSDRLDPQGFIQHRLFRQHCVFHENSYIKDLSRLGRNVDQCIIVDNAPSSYLFHPQNAVPIESWFDNPEDTALRDLIPFFTRLAELNNIYPALEMA